MKIIIATAKSDQKASQKIDPTGPRRVRISTSSNQKTSTRKRSACASRDLAGPTADLRFILVALSLLHRSGLLQSDRSFASHSFVRPARPSSIYQ